MRPHVIFVLPAHLSLDQPHFQGSYPPAARSSHPGYHGSDCPDSHLSDQLIVSLEPFSGSPGLSVSLDPQSYLESCFPFLQSIYHSCKLIFYLDCWCVSMQLDVGVFPVGFGFTRNRCSITSIWSELCSSLV